ncbi:MAG TPA: hypothetical protein VLC53_12660 [Myxococcota bacterium]|nr:hypothetical protein [Myxococcota bacterium]
MSAGAPRRLRAAALALAAALCAGGARAHVLFERATLREWLLGADLAVVAEFEGDARLWQAPDGSDRQEWFRVRVVETLRGTAPGATLDFTPHAEGFPAFRAGDRALLFLARSATRPEFAGIAARFPWISFQGAGHEWRLVGGDGAAILAVARRWAALSSARTGLQAELRDLLLAELGSGVARLRADALSELVAMRGLPGFLDATTTAALAAWADAPGLPAAQRLALVKLLDGAPGFDAPARLRALADAPLEGPALLQLIRVAGASDDPELRAWLVARSEDPRPAVRREASAALLRSR